MSATQYFLESLTRHQVFIQRHGAGIANNATEQLEQMLDRVNKQLIGTNNERLFFASREIQSFIEQEVSRIAEDASQELIDFAEYEAGFTERLFSNAISVSLNSPSQNQILAALTNNAMTLVSGQSAQSLTMSGMFDVFKDKHKTDVTNVIRDGIVTGQTVNEMVRDVGLKGKRAKQDLRATILTATNNAGQAGRQAFYAENTDVIEGLRWVSTLDMRTTLVCIGRDSKVYPINDGPRPPAHYRCRSIMVPDIDEEFAIPGFQGERSSEFGPVSDKTTYNSWLKRQSKEFQDAVLGETRAKLFRGGMNVDKFTDDFGRTLTLEELQLTESITL